MTRVKAEFTGAEDPPHKNAAHHPTLQLASFRLARQVAVVLSVKQQTYPRAKEAVSLIYRMPICKKTQTGTQKNRNVNTTSVTWMSGIVLKCFLIPPLPQSLRSKCMLTSLCEDSCTSHSSVCLPLKFWDYPLREECVRMCACVSCVVKSFPSCVSCHRAQTSSSLAPLH